MGISLKLTDARFDDDKVFNSLTLPFLNGLTCEFILAESLAASERNRAAGLSELTEIGSPTWNADSVSYSTNVVNTGLQLTTSTATKNTMIAVAEKGWGSGALADGGSIGFGGINSDQSCSFATGAYAGVANRARVLNADLPGGFVCFIGRGEAGGLGKITAWNAGVAVEGVATAPDGTATTGVMDLGGDDGTNSNGTFKVAYFAHFNRVLTDAECVQAYLSLKSYFATRGVAIS